MNTQKHMPWTVATGKNNSVTVPREVHIVFDDDSIDGVTLGPLTDTNKANADKLALWHNRTANAHAALVEALQKIADGEAGPLESRKDSLWRQTVAENALRNAGLALASKGA